MLEPTTPNSLFVEAVNALSDDQLKEAKEKLVKLDEQHPSDPTILYNLGLVEFRNENLGRAIAYWRKALNISPGLERARLGIARAKSQLPVKELPRSVTFFDSVQSGLVQKVSIDQILLLLCFSVAVFFWSFFGFIQRRREVGEFADVKPPLPLSVIVYFSIFVFSATLLGLKSYDLKVVRATVIEKEVPAKTGPGDSYGTSFDLFEGIGVIVRQSKDGWVQVTYPGGKTGWVPENKLIVSSGDTSW